MFCPKSAYSVARPFELVSLYHFLVLELYIQSRLLSVLASWEVPEYTVFLQPAHLELPPYEPSGFTKYAMDLNVFSTNQKGAHKTFDNNRAMMHGRPVIK